MTHNSFAAWVVAEVQPLPVNQLRLDGWAASAGGNRAIFGRFSYKGRTWEVHGDTRIERVMRAYHAITSGTLPDPFVIEFTGKRDCLCLAESLRRLREYKYFFVYETK